MSKSNYDEIRRVRHEMSAKVGHDIGKLIDMMNERRSEYADRIINPGKEAEECKPLVLPIDVSPVNDSTAPSTK
jgi:hypothetical protein